MKVVQMAWHMGYPLSQTLFTNLYIDGILLPTPSSLDEADFVRNPEARERRPFMPMVLRAYCLGLLKSCAYVIDQIRREMYYEVRFSNTLAQATQVDVVGSGGRLRDKHIPPAIARRYQYR